MQKRYYKWPAVNTHMIKYARSDQRSMIRQKLHLVGQKLIDTNIFTYFIIPIDDLIGHNHFQIDKIEKKYFQ